MIAAISGVTLLAATATMGVGVMGNRAWADDGTRHDRSQTATEVVVKPGDTLWAIARRHAKPGEDIRRKVYEIMKANGMTDVRLEPGMVIVVPMEGR